MNATPIKILLRTITHILNIPTILPSLCMIHFITLRQYCDIALMFLQSPILNLFTIAMFQVMSAFMCMWFLSKV